MLQVVKDYQSVLDLVETEKAIKLVKDTFEQKLSKKLDLLRVSAPLFVEPKTGLNDNLNGYEKAVNFVCQHDKTYLEIVHSLAKWKRHALKKYEIEKDKGIYTDMNAIRACEELDNLHSLYVDQWDWEKVIDKDERNVEYLKEVVKNIYSCLLETEDVVKTVFPKLECKMPKDITFITTKELEEIYPSLSRKERENAICKEYGAVFLMQIGDKLSDGAPHDGRAADYDDWSLNGDILVWYEPLGIAFEISSMGIRVDKKALKEQLVKANEEYKLEYEYHKDIMENRLPLTIGGGIGQSRICMFFLKKVHIGEVQASYWPSKDLEELEKNNIHLL